MRRIEKLRQVFWIEVDRLLSPPSHIPWHWYLRRAMIATGGYIKGGR